MLKYTISIILYLLMTQFALADGLLLPGNRNYPEDLMRHRLTRIDVHIHGQFAETRVYQEFVNDGSQITDAVYSFPLPADARATNFFYWKDDICYRAKLRVREQATNPGTGEGGVAAYVNNYIGNNGIKIALQNIEPGEIQETQLEYISQCEYYEGKLTYTYPLDTQQFLTHPLDLLSVTIYVHSNSPILNPGLPSHPDFEIMVQEENYARIELRQSKTYLNNDLVFNYEVAGTELGVDFFSVSNDTTDGHFVMTIKPEENAAPEEALNQRIIFLMDLSNRMFGDAFLQSQNAITRGLSLLKSGDSFNLGVFDNATQFWQTQLMPATAENIANAQSYLSTFSIRSGSNMNTALLQSMDQFPEDSLAKAIVVFSSGYTTLDPREIEALNTKHVGIFTVGMGSDLERSRLEMTSLLNYGITSYFDPLKNIQNQATRLFTQISQPILTDTYLEFGISGASEIFPAKIPALFSGSRLFLTGRFQQSGKSAFSIAGYSVNGMVAHDFHLDFSPESTENKFAAYFWAKEKIDALEREILVYGENEDQKQELIEISLAYNIRCKYTAYVADYDPAATGVNSQAKEIAKIPESYILGNYPNPFNPTTTIRFYLSPADAQAGQKIIRIYNMLGQLVAVIDISHLETGIHSIKWIANDMNGNPLPSGLYICRLIVNGVVSAGRMSLVR